MTCICCGEENSVFNPLWCDECMTGHVEYCTKTKRIFKSSGINKPIKEKNK